MVKLTEEQERLVLENEKFVYYLLNKMGWKPGTSLYDELAQEGILGLQKAAMTFNEALGNTFLTYASRCISNSIFMYLRKNKKHEKVISLSTPIKLKDNDITLEDTIKDPTGNFSESFFTREELINIINKILNYPIKKEKLVMLYFLSGKRQQEIGNLVKLSQSRISRMIKKAISKIKQIAESQVEYKEVFSMAIVGDAYRISFASRDVGNFNKIFSSLLKNLTTTEGLPDFKVSCNKERIVIQVPAHPESFSFIAQIIGKIDDFSMNFISDNSIQTESDASQTSDVSQPESEVTQEEEKSDDEGESKEADVTESIPKETCEENPESDLETTEQVSEKIEPVAKDKPEEQSFFKKDDTTEVLQEKTENLGQRKKSKTQQAKEYILSLDSFTLEQLRKAHTEFGPKDIANALHRLKQRGLIKSVERGAYKVNKK